jgi:hypothetical protein
VSRGAVERLVDAAHDAVGTLPEHVLGKLREALLREQSTGFAVLVLMRRGRGRSEGINGEEDFERDHDGGLVGVSKGVAQAVEDIDSAIAFGLIVPEFP